jgi:hypothetical protein
MKSATELLQTIAALGAAYRTYGVRHQLDGLGYPQDDKRPWVVIDLASGKVVDRSENSISATARACVLDATRHHA